MKAPFSDKARKILSDEKASKEFDKIVKSKGNFVGAKMHMSSGKPVKVYSSAKPSKRGYRR